MQIGIDVGATKIETVILEDSGNESHRSRIKCPKNYTQVIQSIKDIVQNLEKEIVHITMLMVELFQKI